MKKHTLLVFLFLSLSNFCYSEVFLPQQWLDFKGISSASNLHLSLYRFSNHQLKGSYCDSKINRKVVLRGKIIGDRLELKAFYKGRLTGYVEVKILAAGLDSLSATWFNSQRKELFSSVLKLQSLGANHFQHRYGLSIANDVKVENFALQVKKAILFRQKAWLAKHIQYPLKVQIKGKQTIVKNNKQLIAHYENVFHSAFNKKIASVCVCNLFSNAKGLMLGDGEIWFQTRGNAIAPDFKIIAINN
ncbi:MAG: hypothetical protein K2Q03_09520 [Sphingobacteriaceae bacterium]|nr:hypothetical protein [Sphingobacteriaceae bacterium]